MYCLLGTKVNEMLNAQISGLESLSYQTGRQLDMNVKAFLLRKQHKDKALMKLTKVHHGEDYAQFVSENYGFTSECRKKASRGDRIKRITLPCIKMEASGQILGCNSKGGNGSRKTTQFCQFVSSNDFSLDKRDRTALQQSSEYEEIHFPPVQNGNPTAHIINIRHEESDVLDLVSPHDLSVRSEKSVSSLTGVSPVSSEKNYLAVYLAEEDGHTSVNRSKHEYCTDIPTEKGVTFEQGIASKKVGHRDGTDTVCELGSAAQDHVGGIQTAKGKKKSGLDRRFNLPQRVLVRQEPTNEGFRELSSSFVKPNSFNFVAEES